MQHLPFLWLWYFSILPYQVHCMPSATIRRIPAATTSTKAIKKDLWGDKPAVARDSAIPSKLQETIKLPLFMPSKAFWATFSAVIQPDEAAMILVSSGFLLFSVKVTFQIVLHFDYRIHRLHKRCYKQTFNKLKATILFLYSWTLSWIDTIASPMTSVKCMNLDHIQKWEIFR